MRDFHARLVVYGIPEMSDDNFRRLIDWLRHLADECERTNGDDYATVFTAKLMK